MFFVSPFSSKINMSVRHQPGHTRSLIRVFALRPEGLRLQNLKKESRRVTQDPRFPIANSEDCQTEVMSKLI